MKKPVLKPNSVDPAAEHLSAVAAKFVSEMDVETLKRIGAEAIANAHRHQEMSSRGQSIKKLRDENLGQEDRAVVIAAGPSAKTIPIVDILKQNQFKGAVVTTESALLLCLRQGFVPDLVVTVDPHPKRIVRWFGDPHLTAQDLREDDYFARQDLDRDFSDQLRINDEVLRLVDQYGPQIRMALSTSSSQAVVDRVMQAGMQVYWWNPIYDEPSQPNSLTRQVFELNRLPCLNAGGNVGSACFMFAAEVLGKSQVALTGIDLGYFAETPYRNTQYYYEAINLVGEDRLDEFYTRIFNPYLQRWFYTDPVYYWYRQVLLDMIAESQAKVYNCTEGGILFGDGVACMPLQKFLSLSKRT